MPPATDTRATLDDLDGIEGKAELIGGRIVHLMGSGDPPALVAFEIAVSLREHARATGRGQVRADGLNFACGELAAGRESCAPDAAYDLGPRPANRMRYVDGAPTFAVEVRSEFDRGPAALREMAAKRSDYFEAGTLVVCDVDTEAGLIHVYRHNSPGEPTTYRRGDVAEAEPAVDGWRIEVDTLFG